MARLRDHVIRAGLETLYFSGAHRFLRYFYEGVGVILTLHHVRPERDADFQPNHILEITPEFLEAMIGELRRNDIDLISLDEMHQRMQKGNFRRRFACLTFDDGYRDNKTYAYPILRAHDVPFAIYVPTSFIARTGEPWWLALEAVIAGRDEVTVEIAGERKTYICRSTDEKNATFSAIYWSLRALPTDDDIRSVMRALSAQHGIDMTSFCQALCMTWSELAQIALDPLVTIGAHTVNHPMLAKTPLDTAREEMQTGRAAIAKHLGKLPAHFSFPFGDPTSAGQREFALATELGFRTAVTTRPGVLFPEHRQHMTALPRISINGDYQKLRYVDVLLSGAATAAWNGFRRIDAA